MTTGTSHTFDAEELRDFVANVLDVDSDMVTDDAHFVAELGADSLKALEVMVGLEKKYQIKINEEEVRDMTTFAEVRDLVAAKLDPL
jgi:acyl carrier protein